MNARPSNREERRRAAQHMAREAKRYGRRLELVDPAEFAHMPALNRGRVWRSSDFLVQEYLNQGPAVVARLTVNRTALDASGGWRAEISWDELQGIKNECGFGGFDAVELFPKACDVVHVANMRHLWILQGAVSFAWRNVPADDPAALT